LYQTKSKQITLYTDHEFENIISRQFIYLYSLEIHVDKLNTYNNNSVEKLWGGGDIKHKSMGYRKVILLQFKTLYFF